MSVPEIIAKIEHMINLKQLTITNNQVMLLSDNEYLYRRGLLDRPNEWHHEFGELYPDKMFYIIRLRGIVSGIATLMTHTLNKIYLALKEYKDAEIVIDYSGFWNKYIKKDEIGIINWWEYYFEQPNQYTLKAVYNSKNVCMSSIKENDSMFNINSLIDNADIRKKAINLYKKYVYINKRVQQKIDRICNELLQNNEKILGVAYRGTDYKRVQKEIEKSGKVIGECGQPKLEDLIIKAKKLCQEWGCTKVFFTTEDRSALELFKQEFKNDLLYTNVARYPSDTLITFDYSFKRDNDEYLTGEEYLLNIVILSRCNCLLTGRHGMISMVLILNENKYENKFIYNIYGKEEI